MKVAMKFYLYILQPTNLCEWGLSETIPIQSQFRQFYSNLFKEMLQVYRQYSCRDILQIPCRLGMLGNCELRAGALGSPASQDINNSRLCLSSRKSDVCLNPPWSVLQQCPCISCQSCSCTSWSWSCNSCSYTLEQLYSIIAGAVFLYSWSCTLYSQSFTLVLLQL